MSVDRWMVSSRRCGDDGGAVYWIDARGFSTPCKMPLGGSSYLGLHLAQDLAVLLQLEQLSLFLEDLSCPLKHHLEALLAFGRVLLEALDSELLDAFLDLLPAAAERRNLCSLGEGCAGCGF